MKKRLVLIGAGHAHLHVLKSLTMLAPQPFDDVEITLIRHLRGRFIPPCCPVGSRGTMTFRNA